MSTWKFYHCERFQTQKFPTSTPNTPYSKLFKSGFQNWKSSLVAKHTCSLCGPQVAYRIQANKEDYKEYTLTLECSPSIVIRSCFAIRLKTEKIKKVLCDLHFLCRKSRRLWSRGNRWCDLNHRGCWCWSFLDRYRKTTGSCWDNFITCLLPWWDFQKRHRAERVICISLVILWKWPPQEYCMNDLL